MTWEHMLTSPEIFVPGLALSIPILAVLFWGIKGVVHAMRGEPDDFDKWQRELAELHTRVDQLERSLKGSQPPVAGR